MYIVLNEEKETDSVILFLHIPKTAGNTLHQIFYDQYTDNIFTKFNQQFKDLTIQQKRKIKYIGGHFEFGFHEKLPHKKYIYITLLRDPIERVVSNYYYKCRMKNHKKPNEVPNMTLYDFVTKEKHNKRTTNLQTRKLSGNDKANLETAKNNLKKYFSVVGITERFDETLYCICNELGWKKIDNYTDKNVTTNRPTLKEIPNEIIEIIKRKNQKDIELYQFANKLLDKNLRQLKK